MTFINILHLICIALQYAILLTIVVTIQMKYVLHIIDLRSENPWDNKAVYLLYTELITGKRKTNSAVIVTCMFMSLRFKMFEHDRRKEQKNRCIHAFSFLLYFIEQC